MKKVLEKLYNYNNSQDLAYTVFGFEKDEVYDALIVAPSFTPDKIKVDQYCKVTPLKERASAKGYLVEKDGLKIAWIKIASGDSNTIDYICMCAELNFKKMIFIGSVGALKENFKLGEVCTPKYSIAGGYAHTYLKESIKDFIPFEKITPNMSFVDKAIKTCSEQGINIKKASVFCTASIAFEYYHLNEIREFDTDLIEMETASFYAVADFLKVDSIALLVVSDNSTTNTPFIGRSEEEQGRYLVGRDGILPKAIFQIIKM